MNENLKELDVIILGQHCWNSLGQIRSFGEVDIKSNVIWVNVGGFTPKGSRYIRSFHVCDSFEEAIEYMLNTFNDPQKRYIISTDSDKFVSLLNQRYSELKDQYIFFNAGVSGRLNHFMQKSTQIRLAKDFGLDVPKTETVKIGELPKELKYPIFTKVNNCLILNWKDNSFICKDQAELLSAYDKMTTDSVILQEYIEKDNEIAFEGISFHDGNEVYMPIQGEYLRIEDGNYGTWKKNEVYHMGDGLKSKIKAIMQHIKYNGVFEIEFLRDKKGKLYFLEINFRHTQYNHALTDMGVNLCYLFAISQINGVINQEKVIKSPSITMNEDREYHKYIKTGKMSIRNWIRDIRNTDSFYVYDKNDKRYFFKKLASLPFLKLLSMINN